MCIYFGLAFFDSYRKWCGVIQTMAESLELNGTEGMSRIKCERLMAAVRGFEWKNGKIRMFETVRIVSCSFWFGINYCSLVAKGFT